MIESPGNKSSKFRPAIDSFFVFWELGIGHNSSHTYLND